MAGVRRVSLIVRWAVLPAVGLLAVAVAGVGESAPVREKQRAKPRGSPADRIQSTNNLKQLGLAMHGFHDTYQSFPPAATYKDGKPLLSWRVTILPFIEQNNLYQKFHLDEPWDSAHNKELLSEMPELYAPPGLRTPEPGLTVYQVFTGREAAFEMKKGRTLAQLANGDGTSNTMMIVEAAKPVPWTKPEDLRYDPKGPVPGLGGLSNEWFNAALCDGSVRTFKKPAKEKMLRAFITWNGNEPPGDYQDDSSDR